MKKTCLVTGANSGIGRSTAISLAKSGYSVFATMRSLKRGEKLREITRQLDLDIREIELDVSETASVQQGIDEILGQSNQIDVLINNAGIGSNAVIEDVDIELYQGITCSTETKHTVNKPADRNKTYN